MLKHLQSRADWEEKSLGAKGFTLIELLVVIVILGILAGVAIFAIGSIRDDANTASCATEKSTIETAAEAWKTRNGTYPANITAMVGGDNHLKQAPKAGRWSETSISTGTLTPVADGPCAPPTP